MAVVGSTADVTLASGDKFSAQTADEADGCMVYPDVYCYTPFYGLYKDSWSDTSGYHLDTQALALLAFSRLYQATQKEEYITRADALINAIMQYFFVGGLGAGADSFSSGVRSTWINGSSNAMLAMALGDLYKSTGDSKYSGLCQDIATFMNKYMWEDAGNIKGYCEYFNATSLSRASDPNNPEATANAKLMSTNAMMMYANEMVMYANRSFWDIYGFWVIVGSVLLIAIIAIVILVSRRRTVGTKLSKTVKGLISEA
ncbi:MAG TPA: hypothetical protein VKK79_09080, partial [Candidatus Lokiarchaeia archaeon]|nr:hypothetical protein [Candidatus Lokiarchaeia archaeon]